jgi:hypothetical protein
MPYKDREKQKEYQRKHYRDNKEIYRATRKRNEKFYRDRNKNFCHRVKKSFGCVRCSYDKCLTALEFHHKDASEKDIEISRLIRGKWSIKTIKNEMRKCVVLCANCHREVHEEIDNGITHNWEEIINDKQKR